MEDNRKNNSSSESGLEVLFDVLCHGLLEFGWVVLVQFSLTKRQEMSDSLSYDTSGGDNTVFLPQSTALRQQMQQQPRLQR